jgi:hypothetical protein
LEDTKQTLENFVVLLTVLLGTLHPQTQYNQRLLTSLRQKMHRLDNIMAVDPTQAHLPAILLRRPQVEFSDWAETQIRSNAPVQPDTALNVVNQAAMNIMSWTVPLPPGYLNVVPSNPGGGPGRVNNSNPGGGLPGGGTPGGGTPGGGSRSMIMNTHPDPRFDRFRDRGVRSRAVKDRCREQNIPLPKRANGKTRCLPYHVVLKCNENCNCREDHVNDHTEAEQAELEQFCEQNWTAS